jgi:hypothetical protein
VKAEAEPVRLVRCLRCGTRYGMTGLGKFCPDCAAGTPPEPKHPAEPKHPTEPTHLRPSPQSPVSPVAEGRESPVESGRRGGQARAMRLDPVRRREIVQAAARRRWGRG